MGLFSGIAKAGLARRVVDEARKPHNRSKIKQMAARFTGGSNRGGIGRTP